MRAVAEKKDVDKAVELISGYWTGFIVNLILIMVSLVFLSEGQSLSNTPMIWLPWAINALIFIGAIIMAPDFLIGYLIALAALFVAVLLYIPSCMATCIVATAFGLEPDVIAPSGLEYWFWPLFFILYAGVWLAASAHFSHRHFEKAARKDSGNP